MLPDEVETPPVEVLTPPVDVETPPVDVLTPPVEVETPPVDVLTPPVEVEVLTPPVEVDTPPDVLLVVALRPPGVVEVTTLLPLLRTPRSSEERRAGNESGSPCSTRWSRDTYDNKTTSMRQQPNSH